MAGPDDDFNPFTGEDRERIFHEETCDNQKEGWQFVSRNEHTEVWKKSNEDSPIHLVKGFLRFPGVPPQAVLEMITDLEVRKKWDTQFPIIDVIEEHKHYKVVYWRVKMPPGISDRDLVQHIGYRKDEDTGTWYIMYKNAEHPSRPVQSGVVRAETILSGSIIRADEKDPSSTRLCVLLQNDAKGLIPTVIVNLFQSRAPGNWRDSLYNYYMKEYRSVYESKHPEESKTTGT